MNIIELLGKGKKTALIQNGRRISYSELLAAGLSFGGRLRLEGIARGGNVLIFIPLSIELYIAMIGVWSIGASAIFIDFSRGAGFVSDSTSRLKPDAIVCDSVTMIMRGMYPQMRRLKAIHINEKGLPAAVEKVEPEHPAILTFTSGTTGYPKIAVRSHGFLINQYKVLSEHFDFDESNVDLGTLPVFTLSSLASNMTTLLPDKSYFSKTNDKRLWGQMSREGVTRAICSPSLIARLLKHGDIPSLRSLYLGGGPVYPGILGKVRGDIDLRIVYGSTEAEPIAGVRWRDVSPEDRQKIADGKGLLAGAVSPEIECEITNEQEIIVTGDTVLKGYLGGVGDAENKLRRDGKIWHRTGDAGYLDDRGNLWLLGRVSQAIHDNKGTLYPFCVECVLDARFGIRGAIMLRGGKRVVVIEKGAAPPLEVLSALRTHGIEQVITINKLPMDNRHGAKIDYARLNKLLERNM